MTSVLCTLGRYKSVHVIGFDLCEACHANPRWRHPYPLVRRPAPTDGTEAPRVATRLTPGGGGVLVSSKCASRGGARGRRSALRDLQLLEGLWMNRRDAAAPNLNPNPNPNPNPTPTPTPTPNP